MMFTILLLYYIDFDSCIVLNLNNVNTVTRTITSNQQNLLFLFFISSIYCKKWITPFLYIISSIYDILIWRLFSVSWYILHCPLQERRGRCKGVEGSEKRRGGDMFGAWGGRVPPCAAVPEYKYIRSSLWSLEIDLITFIKKNHLNCKT